MTDRESTRLILFSGLAADASVFGPQTRAFPQLIVPEWPVPTRADTMDSYCRRLATDLRTDGRTVIGGASFGGIVALHVAQYLNPLAIILIGSIRAPTELPRYARWARPLRPLIRFVPVRFLQCCVAPLAWKWARSWFSHISVLARQFQSANPTVFKWSLERILDWKHVPRVACPIFHIHGQRDLILPLRYTTPDQQIEGGRHVISLTHPRQTNKFIREVLETMAAS